MKAVSSRLTMAQQRLAAMEEYTSTRVDLLESRVQTMELAETLDKIARKRVAVSEKSMKRQMDTITIQLRSTRASAAASIGAQPACAAQGQDGFDPSVKIGGFMQETPRGVLQEAWASDISAQTWFGR